MELPTSSEYGGPDLAWVARGADAVRGILQHPELPSGPGILARFVARSNRGWVLGAVDLLEKPVRRNPSLNILRQPASRPQPRVLVVDDDDEACRLMREQLQPEAEVEVAVNGQEALESLDKGCVDLIVLELRTPVMNGSVVLKSFREEARHRDAPVTVVSPEGPTEHENLF